MTSPFHRLQFLKDSLESRKQNGQFRELIPIESAETSRIQVNEKSYINLSSNDYLGLRVHPEMISCSKYFTDRYGTGSGASRLITGTGEYHHKLESELAIWLEVESVLVFNSGYQLNSTLIASIADRDTVVYSDRLNHNSLVQGIVASRATLRRYKHLDYVHLESMLHKDAGTNRKIIVTESVFSMDGDVVDLGVLSDLAEAHNAILIVDEAHAIGVLGPGGKGVGHTNKRIDIRIGTFGKAFGSFGAYVAGSSELISYLINHCGGFIYTTALPPAVIGATHCALDLLKEMDSEREYLIELSSWFRNELDKLGFNTFGSASHIVPVYVGDEFRAIYLSEYMKEQGYWVNAIRPPTVEPGTSRLRFTLSTLHTKEDLTGCIEIIQKGVSSKP